MSNRSLPTGRAVKSLAPNKGRPKLQRKRWIDAGAENCEHVVFYDVGWDFYIRCLEAAGDRRLRMTFDGTNLEIMTVSRAHERAKTLLARMLESLTLELGIPLVAGGSMTFKREDSERGLEPDECYWIANASKVPGDHDLDFTKDPPPDLAVEVEHTRALLDRIEVYARLRVPEVWKYDGQRITILRLRNGGYVEVEKSQSLPFLPVAELASFLKLHAKRDDNAILREFVNWVRKQDFKVP